MKKRLKAEIAILKRVERLLPRKISSLHPRSRSTHPIHGTAVAVIGSLSLGILLDIVVLAATLHADSV
jgi:hypothetical protein